MTDPLADLPADEMERELDVSRDRSESVTPGPLALGAHRGIPMAEYLRLPYLSASTCNTLLQCSPYHAKWQRDHREADDTEASDAGTAIHSALLEGMDIIAPLDFKDWRTNASKEARDVARAEGRIPMLSHKVPQVEAAVTAARAFMERSELAESWAGPSESEQTIVWREGSLFCKARPDWSAADHSLIIHLKTTQGSAQPDSWIRNQLVPAGYDCAAMFYERGIYSLPGEGRDALLSVFLVIEQNAPHGCSLVGLSPAMQELAGAKVERAIRTWKQCQATGRFPCYPSRIAYAEPMPWQVNAEDDQALRDHLTDDELKGGIPA